MILLHLDKKLGVVYFNLREKKSYYLDHDKDPVVEVIQPFNKDFVEKLMLEEIWLLQNTINFLEDPTTQKSEQDKVDVIRFKSSIDYLINYEF